MADYTTLAVVKDYVGLPASHDADDAALTAAINAAEDRIDQHCGRTFVVPSAVSTRVVRPWSDTVVRLPAELAQLDDLAVSVDTTDNGTAETALTSTDYYVVGDQAPYLELVRVSGRWPRPTSGRATVHVEGWYGYAMAVPAAVTQAATMLAGRLYHRQSSPLGITVGASPEFGAVRVGRIDPDVAQLLVGYRLPAVA